MNTLNASNILIKKTSCLEFKQILISCRLLNLSILEVYMSLRKFYLINPISGLEVPWFQGLNNKDISFKEKVKV